LFGVRVAGLLVGRRFAALVAAVARWFSAPRSAPGRSWWGCAGSLCKVRAFGVLPHPVGRSPGRNAMALPLSRRDERCAQGSGELPASKYVNAAALLRRGAKQGGSASFGLARHIAL